MRAILFVIIASLPALGFAAPKPPGFEQVTRVEGKVPVKLGGAWFLFAQAQFAGGKARALAPQLFTVSQRNGHDVTLHLLDVQFPKSIDDPYKATNRQQPTGWEPSPSDIALLGRQWSRLPPAREKDVRAGEVVYDRVEFTLASPEKYAEVFADQNPGVSEALSGSVFAFRIVEKYRAQPVPPGENIAQVMERKSIYVVRSAGDSVLEGEQFTGYMASGPGVPIPIALKGPFKLYRLAKGAVVPAGGHRARRCGTLPTIGPIASAGIAGTQRSIASNPPFVVAPARAEVAAMPLRSTARSRGEQE